MLKVVDGDADLHISCSPVSKVGQTCVVMLVNSSLSVRILLLEHRPCICPRQVVEVTLALDLALDGQGTEGVID